MNNQVYNPNDQPPPYPGYAGPADSLAYSGPPDSLDNKGYTAPSAPPGLEQQSYDPASGYGPPGQYQTGYGPPGQYQTGSGPPGQPGYGPPGYAPAGLPGQVGYGVGPPGLPGQQIYINQQNTVIMSQEATTSEAFIVKEDPEAGCGDCYVNCKGRCGSSECGLCCEKFWLCERGNKWYSPAGKGIGWLIVLIFAYLTVGIIGAILCLAGLIIFLMFCSGN